MEKHHKKEHHEHVEHKVEHVHEQPQQSGIKVNIWMLATVILAVALIAVFAMGRGAPATSGTAAKIGADECGARIVAYLNDNLVQEGTSAALASVKEQSGVYEITTLYQGRNVSVYSSEDCQILFLSALNTSEDLYTENTVPQQAEPVKTDKPVVDLYVMSFCPYGVQAEQIMKPVVDLLGSAADINIRFIASVGGNTTDSVQSLHGIEEAKEDLRQLCVNKYYPEKLWPYVMDIDTNCYPIYRNSTAMDACWKSAATKLGISTSTIETCAYGSEGLSLLSADETLTDQYGVSGSPTIMINGQRYSGARSSAAFQQAICDAFTTAPSACSQSVASSNVTASSGGC
jgi:glutaredoxin